MGASEVWQAVGRLWRGFGDDPEQVITSAFTEARGFVDALVAQGGTAEAAAIQVVVEVVSAYIKASMAPDDRQAVLAELQKILTMRFDEAEGYPALPLVSHVVEAWKTAQDWAAAGLVEPQAPKQLIGAFVRALASAPPS